jgi:hypothetical protein
MIGEFLSHLAANNFGMVLVIVNEKEVLVIFIHNSAHHLC